MSMRPGRNDPCPCGSGRKYKHCCGAVGSAAPTAGAAVAVAPGANSHELGALASMINDGRLAQAEERLRALARDCPADGTIWKFLGVALQRQGKEALPVLRRATQLLPYDAEAHGNLGAALCDARQWEAALASLRRSLALEARNPGVLLDAGNALRALGRPRDALPSYHAALQVEPGSAEAHNNLGNAYVELGQPADAVGCYRRALEIRPLDAPIHFNLANALRQLGQLAEALACSQRAIELDEGLSAAHNNLGLCLVGLGERARAVESFRHALRLNGNYIEALNNLGKVLRDLGEREEAVSLHRKAVDLDAQRAESHCNLGNVLLDLRRLDEAGSSFRRALLCQTDCQQAHLGLAAVLRLQGHDSEAEASCRAALAQEPNSVEALLLLGELHADHGRFSEARELFERARAIDPEFPTVYSSLAAQRKMTEADAGWLRAVEALLAKPQPLGNEISLRYALGKYFDDVGRYDEAFSNYRQANELTKRYGSSYDGAKFAQRVDAIIGMCDADFTSRPHTGASASELPVFIVGMPRSGTSLTEQILASHPAVFGAGEVRFWNSAFNALDAQRLKGENVASLLPGMAHDYLERVAALSRGRSRVTDKMPANFLYAGVIHAALPRARIIHMQRDPLDTCLSIYFQNIPNMGPYANDLEKLAHYYGQYLRVTSHWRAVLPPAALLEVPYEALVAEPEVWTRRMLEFIGLPWDPKCLEFEQTDRVVITASRWQVRQKIHAASTGRWRNYEKHLAPLRHLVELVAAAGPGGAPPASGTPQPMRVASSRPSSSA